MPPVDPAVFACISMVSMAVGPLIAKDIHDILECMFAVGLRYLLLPAIIGPGRRVPKKLKLKSGT